MSDADVLKSIKENYHCLVLALRLGIEAQPASKRRLAIAAALAKIDEGMMELEKALEG
jgi:hypothetical protein